MAKKNEFVDYLMELLADFGRVRSRAMFGGHGIYCDDLMFGLVADNVLYLKVDDQNRSEFETRGMGPFMYVKNGQPMAMSYYQVPEEALDNPRDMATWAEIGFGAAQRAAAKKKPQK